VSFNLLHEKDRSRIQQKIYCPVDDAIIDRSELVRGYEIEKGRYVVFTDEELKNLEATGSDHAIEITEFLPISEVDPVYFEESYFLESDRGSGKAYRLLTDAMASSERVALGRYTMRGKEHLVLLRPYAKGLMLHTLYYADEVKVADEFDRSLNESVKETELTLAKRLIDDLTQKKFDPSQYHDTYRERVIEAAQQKVAGEEVIAAPPSFSLKSAGSLAQGPRLPLRITQAGLTFHPSATRLGDQGVARMAARTERLAPYIFTSLRGGPMTRRTVHYVLTEAEANSNM
jgi:DNA end-binding protein Ku